MAVFMAGISGTFLKGHETTSVVPVASQTREKAHLPSLDHLPENGQAHLSDAGPSISHLGGRVKP
jgi:hypothetical protein